MLKKRVFWLQSVAATVFIFGFMWVASNVLSIFEFLDPIGDALAGYEVTDQVFSDPQWRELPPAEENIVIVNIGNLSRREIAQQINIINSFEPKVIGLDAYFGKLKPDTLGDLILADAIASTNNLITYAKLVNPDSTGLWHDIVYCHPMFKQNHEAASVNLVIEESDQEQHDFKTCRSFLPKEKLFNAETGEIDTVLAFGVRLAQELAPEKTAKFLARNNEEELVNYKGNVIDYGRTRFGTRYFALDTYDVLDTARYTADLLKDKIVLMGFLGKSFDDTRSVEDKYFTPLNSKYTGRAYPDMYGVVVHANIISMILNEEYLDQMSEGMSWAVAIIVCFINVVLFSLIYHNIPKWYDGVTKLIQLTEALILTFIIILVFHFYSFKLDLTYTILAVLLAGDSLEVFFGVIINTVNKFRNKLFTIET